MRNTVESCPDEEYLHGLEVLLFLKHFVVKVANFVVTKISTNMGMSKKMSVTRMATQAFNASTYIIQKYKNLQAKIVLQAKTVLSFKEPIYTVHLIFSLLTKYILPDMFGQESSPMAEVHLTIIMKELLSLVSKSGAILEALCFALCFMQFCMTGLTVCLVISYFYQQAKDKNKK